MRAINYIQKRICSNLRKPRIYVTRRVVWMNEWGWMDGWMRVDGCWVELSCGRVVEAVVETKDQRPKKKICVCVCNNKNKRKEKCRIFKNRTKKEKEKRRQKRNCLFRAFHVQFSYIIISQQGRHSSETTCRQSKENGTSNIPISKTTWQKRFS